MSENIRSTNLRFNLDKDVQNRAWQYLQTMDKKKFKTDIHSYSISKNAPSLNILDATKIPEKYMVVQEPKLDRKMLLADVKANPEEFKGIAETKQTESLKIR